jgi:hypothetical protein
MSAMKDITVVSNEIQLVTRSHVGTRQNELEKNRAGQGLRDM